MIHQHPNPFAVSTRISRDIPRKEALSFNNHGALRYGTIRSIYRRLQIRLALLISNKLFRRRLIGRCHRLKLLGKRFLFTLSSLIQNLRFFTDLGIYFLDFLLVNFRANRSLVPICNHSEILHCLSRLKDSRHCIVILGRDGIKFVIMATSTSHR